MPLTKTLVLRLSSIGDVVLATPLLRCIKAASPASIVHFAIRSEYAPLLARNPHIDRLWIVEKERGISGLRELNARFKREGYTAVLDLHDSHRSKLLRNGIRASQSVIHKRTILRWLLVHTKWNGFREVVPVADRYLETARLFGVLPDGLGPELHVPEETRLSADRILGECGLKINSTAVALCPGARHFTKRWPEEYWAVLRDRILRETDWTVLLVGGSDDADAASRLSAADPARVIDLCGRLGLLETAVAFDRCVAAVTNDSGAMHIASARGIPLVALFGSTVREFGFFPSGASAVVLENEGLSCRPCSHIGRSSCPKGHFACMRDIAPETVWKALCAISRSDRRTGARA